MRNGAAEHEPAVRDSNITHGGYMESITVENYLKAIYQLSDASGGAPTGGLAVC
jgi:hypothetical protein